MRASELEHSLHRRHLNESQKAVIAARLANIEHGGDRKSDQRAKLHLETTIPQAAKMLILGKPLDPPKNSWEGEQQAEIEKIKN